MNKEELKFSQNLSHMKPYEFSFERLNVWKKARKLASNIYTITSSFPESEKFGITNQIRRAAISVTANIAEGSSRFSRKEQSRFYQISFSSLMELLSHLYISEDLKYLEEKSFEEIKLDIVEVSKMLNALYKK